MFYSQLLLSKTGALGVVWMAAHCHKRLRKCDIQQTNISSSVDKILDDEVRNVTHRILAFLLLGIVRIYSKKAEYLFNDCHAMLNRLSSIKTKKSEQAGIGVSLTHYHSISLPKRFELDTFDLELLEDEDVVGGNVRAHGKDKLAGSRRKDASTSGLLCKEPVQLSGAHSMDYTPPRDVFGHHHMGQNILVGPSSNKKISLAGVEVLRGTRFSLGDHIDLDEAEDEQMHEKQTDEDPKMNFQAVTNNMESDSDVGPSNYRSLSLPSIDMVCGTWFALEDRLEPMVLDEAEEEELNGRPSNHQEPIQYVELDFINHQSSKEGDSVAISGVHGTISLEQLPFKTSNEAEKGQGNEKPPKEGDSVAISGVHGTTSLEQLPFVTSNEAEKGQGNEKPPDKEHRVEEEHVEHLSTEFNFQEGEHQNFTASVDNAKAVDAGDKVPEVIILESVKSQRAEELRVSVVTSNSKPPAGGASTSEVAFVQTPGIKERERILKKRKALLDSTSVVVPNMVFKNWLSDVTDIKRKRRDVPDTLLGAWRANKQARFPHSFSEPSIPGISVELEYNRSRVAAPKTVELSNEEECVNSPVTHEAQVQIPVVRSPVAQSLVTEESSKQTPIAPGTPSAAHLDQVRCHEFGAVADSDTFLEPATSYESVGKGPSLSEPLGFDVLFEEETSSFEGESSKKGDIFSTRTRTAVSYLSRKFQDKRSREEEEVLSLTHLLVGKTKKESARFFYETLVLKTRDCIDVQQKAAYHDIVLRETPKLTQVLVP